MTFSPLTFKRIFFSRFFCSLAVVVVVGQGGKKPRETELKGLIFNLCNPIVIIVLHSCLVSYSISFTREVIYFKFFSPSILPFRRYTE